MLYNIYMNLQVGLTRVLIYDEEHAPVPENIGIPVPLDGFSYPYDIMMYLDYYDTYPSEGLLSDTSNGSTSIELTEGQDYSILVACSKYFNEICDTLPYCKHRLLCYSYSGLQSSQECYRPYVYDLI